MIDPPEVTHSTAQLTAVLPLTLPQAEVRDAIDPGVAEVMAALAVQDIAPAGPWFVHYLEMSPSRIELEICVPTTKPIVATGRIRAGELPAAKVARAVYRGPREGLGAAWGELNAWIKEKGLTPRHDLWAASLGSESSSSPTTWRIELNRPLIE